MELKYRVFSSGGVFWTTAGATESACAEAADFANRLPPESIVDVCMSHPGYRRAFVTVWYWSGPRGIEKVEPIEEEARPEVDELIRDTLDL